MVRVRGRGRGGLWFLLELGLLLGLGFRARVSV